LVLHYPLQQAFERDDRVADNHSTRPAIAASVISSRVGRPDLTISSSTCVAQIAGHMCGLAEPQDFLLHLG
jgi:hypothetical protein